MSLFAVDPIRVVGQHTDTNATTKHWRYCSGHYTNAEEPMTGMFLESQSAANYARFGGGSDQGNCATHSEIWCAQTTTEVLGTLVMQAKWNSVDACFNIDFPAGNVVVSGASKHVRSPQGSASAPGFAFQNATTTGLFCPVAGKLCITGASVEMARFEPSWLRLQNTDSDATIKTQRLVITHFTNSEEPLGLVMGSSTANAGQVHIGGGSTLVNAATQISMYTASNSVTANGSERVRVNATGAVNLVTSATVGAAAGTSPSLAFEVTGAMSATTFMRSGSMTDANSAGDIGGGTSGGARFWYDHSADAAYLYDATNVQHQVHNGLWAYKTADETVTNSTTLQNDDHLTVTVSASTKYAFEIELFSTSSSATAGLKVALSGTATVTFLKAQVLLYDDTTNALAALARVEALDTAVGAGLGAGDNYAVVRGSVEINAAGTILLQWAQNVADATNGTVVERNSSMRFWRL